MQVGDDHLLASDLRAERNHRQDEQGGNHDDHRGQPEIGLADVAGGKILLEEGLHPVGHRLKDAKPPDAIGSMPVLNERGNFAFRQDGVGDERHHDTKSAHHLDGAEKDELLIW